MTLLLSIALAEEGTVAARVGVAASADAGGPLVGAHVNVTEALDPVEGPLAFRTGVRLDLRGWRQPDSAEEAFWSAQGVEGLPPHTAFELTGSMTFRATAFEREWAGMRLGAEAGLTAGLWHHATLEVQEAYAEAGASKWPLEEYLLGPELALGLFAPDDRRKVVWVHRYGFPLHGRLDGEENRYTVGDRTFEPVEVVNPRFEGGFTGLYSWDHLFVQLTLSYVLVLPSTKNRVVDQSPPDGSVRADLALGWSF